MLITKVSTFSGKESSMEIDITMDQFNRIQERRELIQNIVPDIPKGQREFLISGMSLEEQDLIFGIDKDFDVIDFEIVNDIDPFDILTD